MTIKEFSTSMGVSTQAIYKRLKTREISPDSITEKGTGQLTAEGEAILKGLYAVNPVEKQSNNLRALQLKVETLTNEKNLLQLEVDKLNSQVETLNAQVETLKEERDFLRQTVNHMQDTEGLRMRIDALEAGQRAAQAQALTDGSSGSGRKRGLFSWLRRKDSGIQGDK